MYLAGTKCSVDTGESYFNEINKSTVAGRRIASYKLQRDRIKNLELSDNAPLKARINYARWIVDCPNCNSAEFAFEDELFLCSSCENSDVKGKVKRVSIPHERKQIEDLLANRNIVNRNWVPGESLDKLKKENKTGEVI